MTKHSRIAADAGIRATADGDGFRAALRLCLRLTRAKSTIPILNFVRITGCGDHLLLTATDLDVEIEVRVEGRGEGDVTLPARTLGAFLAVTSGEVVLSPDQGRVIVSSGGMVLRAQPLPPEDFPAMTRGEPIARASFAEDVLQAALRFAQPCISAEETRYYLNGVLLEEDDGRIRSVATDGHRLASRAVPCLGGLGGERIIVPRGAVACVLAGTEGTEIEMQIEDGARRAVFTMPGVTIRAKLIDGTYPDWRRVLPDGDGAARIDLPKVRLVPFLRAAMAMKAAGVRLAAAEGVHLSTTGPGDSIAATIPGGGDFPTFGIQPRYLLDFARTAPGDTLSLAVRSERDPVEAVGLPDGDLAVIMPMRV